MNEYDSFVDFCKILRILLEKDYNEAFKVYHSFNHITLMTEISIKNNIMNSVISLPNIDIRYLSSDDLITIVDNVMKQYKEFRIENDKKEKENA